jgi:hypothetical protein
MLTFPTSHALTDALITATRDPALATRLPLALFMYERTADTPRPVIGCHLISLQHTAGADGHDTAIVERLETLTREPAGTTGPIPALIRAANTTNHTTSSLRMLACAALDDDIVIAADGPHDCRRLDAVDIDGRVYQLTQHRTETPPVVTVDHIDDPRGIPAVVPALRTALIIAARLTRRY